MWEQIIGGGLSLLGGHLANEATEERMRMQMAFQEKMSNTAYQRAMADMRKAGLNPMLAYSKGGASTPAGSFSPAQDILTPAVSTAQQAKRLTAEVDNMEQTNKNLAEQNKLTQAQIKQVGSQTTQIDRQTQILDQTLIQAIRDAEKAKTDEQFYSSTGGRILRTIGTALRELNPFGAGGQPGRVYINTPGRE